LSQYSIPLHETYVRMSLLSIFFGGFIAYCIYYWCYEMLPYIFPSYWPLWLNIFGSAVYPPITLYSFMITFLYASFRGLIPLLVILGSYLSNPLPSNVRSNLIPLDQYCPDVYSIVKETTSSLGMKLPQCYVLDLPEPEAWTVGRRNKTAKLIVTSGLLELDKSEVKAVVAHELSHILNKDMAFITWANNFVKSSKYWFPVLCAYVMLENALLTHALVFPGLDQLAFLSFNLLFLIVIPLPLINSLSRVREFLADAKAVLILRNPKLVASTLEKIDRMLVQSKLRKLFLSPRLSVVSSSRSSQNKIISYLTATHPSTQSRSTAIERRTYYEARPLTYEASIWVGIIAAGLTNLLDEFIFISIQRTNIFGGFALTEGSFTLTAILEFLLPISLFVVSFMLGVKGRRFTRSPSRSRFCTPSVLYLKQVWTKIIVAVTIFTAIYFPWYWIFTSRIMFEPTAFWEIPTYLFNMPEMFFESWIVVAPLSILLLAMAVETFTILGFVKQEEQNSL
jgi:heat shock protein HtpX